MADKRHLEEPELEALFAAARDEAPLPSAALFERIMGDAQAELGARSAVPAPAPSRRAGLLSGILAGLGGWPSLTGLATAAVTGLLIGYSAPDTLEEVTAGFLSADTGYGLDDLDDSTLGFAGILGEG